MNAKETIRQALKKIMSDGEANACQIWKGYSPSTGLTGWHYIPFGSTAVFLGANAQEALEAVEETLAERAKVG